MNRCLTLLVLPLALIAIRLEAANVLVNPSFETGSLSPWTVNSGAPFVTSTEAHSGSYSVAAFGHESIIQYFSPVAVSDILEVSGWVKRAGGPFSAYSFHYSDGPTTNHTLSGSGNDWLYFNLTANLTTGKHLQGFSIYGTSSGPAYLDDFVIRTADAVIPEPACVWLAVMAAGVMTFYRRRR